MNKKMAKIILGIIALIIVGIYTIKPSIIYSIIDGNKDEEIQIIKDLTDKSFGISLKMPDEWKEGDLNSNIIYTGGELKYKENSIGASIIYVYQGQKLDSLLFNIIKVDKKDWTSLKKNINIGKIQGEIQLKNDKGENIKFYLKDMDYKVKEGKENAYLLICEKKQNALKNQELKDIYVGIEELEKKFLVQ